MKLFKVILMACLQVIENQASRPLAVHSLCELIAIYVLRSFGYEKINELHLDFQAPTISLITKP